MCVCRVLAIVIAIQHDSFSSLELQGLGQRMSFTVQIAM